MAHAVDFKLRKDNVTKNRAKAETIAELVASVCAKIYGVPYISQSQDYIRSYTKNKSNDAVGAMCKSVINEVGKILDFIFKIEVNK